MRFHALVVDDNPKILDNLKDRLESMYHTCDLAGSQIEARKLLAENRYAYVLLDLTIPVKSGRASHATNGENLLWTIRRTQGLENIPIIIMVSQDQQSLRFATKVVRNGGTNNMVLKPFSEHGRALGKAVRDALKQTGNSHYAVKNSDALVRISKPPKIFEQGKLTFYPSRVELCGVKVCGSAENSVIRRILDILKNTDANGHRRSYCGDELADLVSSGPQGVAGAIRNFRMRVKRAMLVEANLKIDPRIDVIANDRLHGYRFSEKIIVSAGHKLTVSYTGQAQNNYKKAGSPDWILAELQKTGQIRKQQIIERSGHSGSTVRRSLARLRKAGQIVFEGSPRSGYWRLVR